MRGRILWPPVPGTLLTVSLSSSHCRQTASSYYERLISECWRELRTSSNAPHNSPLFRLHDTSLPAACTHHSCRAGLTCLCPDPGILVKEQERVELKIGLSDVRDSVVTHHPTGLGADLAYIGYEICKKPQIFLADTISNHVVLLSKDGFVAAVRGLPSGDISNDVTVNPDEDWGLPAGNPDPCECGVGALRDLVQERAGAVQRELLQCVYRVLEEQVGLGLQFAAKQVQLLAVVRDGQRHNKPHLVFVLKCDQSAGDITETFNKGNAKLKYELGFIKIADFKSGEKEGDMVEIQQVQGKKMVGLGGERNSVGATLKGLIDLTRASPAVNLRNIK